MFLDSSKRSLKCVLLHNGNAYGAVPVGHYTVLKEQHDDIKIVIDLLKYHEHKWTTSQMDKVYPMKAPSRIILSLNLRY